MITPIILEDLFELNDNIEPNFDGEVVIIDNIFKNYEKILDVCLNMPVEQWKTSSNSRNFIDYYDCRPIFNNFYPIQDKLNKRVNTLLSITKHFFKLKNNPILHKNFEFNYFKNKIKNLSKNFQFYPHCDLYFNCIIYLDPQSNGGTAIYKNVNNFKNNEDKNLFYDISSLEIEKIIQSKPNRCVIFPGYKLHGGYIEDHNTYLYNWRINLVHFLINDTNNR